MSEPVKKNGGLTGEKIQSDVEITYFVEPAPAGQNRSGKCVVQYKIKTIVTGTRGGGPWSAVVSTLGGDLWFIDDNLKTKTLANP